MSDMSEKSGDTDPLNASPTRGDAKGGGFPGGGGGEGIDVKPEGLKLFSSQALGDVKDFQSATGDVMPSLMEQSAKIGVSFREASDFAAVHSQGVGAIGKLSGDASKGLMALSLGAMSIGNKYLDGDATSAATMKDVQNAFDVSGGKGFFNGADAPDGKGPTGQGGGGRPGSLPEAEPITADDVRNSERPSYPIADPQDIRDVEKQTLDDLAKEKDKDDSSGLPFIIA